MPLHPHISNQNETYFSEREKEILLFAMQELTKGLPASTSEQEDTIDILIAKLKPKPDLSNLTLSEKPKLYPRKCDACGNGMFQGFCIGGGEQYFCSEKCLHTQFTEAEYLKMYADGEGSSYWTEWSEDDIDHEDEPIYEHNHKRP